MRSFTTIGAALLPLAAAVKLNVNDEASIKAASSQYANGLMSYYKANASGTPATEVGYIPKPHYWWESGAMWGAMVEYTTITGDESYVKTIQQGLVANYGPANNFILDYKRDQTGNDDQAFWCLATMSAAEYGFPEPADASATYAEVSKNCFNNIVSRWDETSCGGGLKWQIYPENAYGYHYKNSISNGATFALGARLARFTGNQTYADWAEKIYDWEKKVGLIGDNFEVFDGTGDDTNCKEVSDKTEWTYNNAMMIHGSAFMAAYTGSDKWTQRTEGFLKRAGKFFENPNKVSDVMFEVCENPASGRTCNLDQQSFKAYLARWMAKTAILVPSTKKTITNYLTNSAAAAAKVCTGENGACGSRWYQEYDGQTGVGQQMSALEVTQACLYIQQGTLPGTGGESSQPKPSSSAVPKPSSTAAPESSKAPKTSEAPQSEALKTSKAPESSPSPKTSEAAAKPSESPVGHPTGGAPVTNVISVSQTQAASVATDMSQFSYPVGEHTSVPVSSQSDTASVPTSIPQLSFSGGEYVSVSISSQVSSWSDTASVPTNIPQLSFSNGVYVSVGPSAPTSSAGGQFGEAKSSTCSCTEKKTTTVYVNPPAETTPAASCTLRSTTTVYVNAPPTSETAAASPPPLAVDTQPPPAAPTPTVVPTGVLPPSPSAPANSSDSELFDGAASNVKLGVSTAFAAVGLAVLAALL